MKPPGKLFFKIDFVFFFRTILGTQQNSEGIDFSYISCSHIDVASSIINMGKLLNCPYFSVNCFQYPIRLLSPSTLERNFIYEAEVRISIILELRVLGDGEEDSIHTNLACDLT